MNTFFNLIFICLFSSMSVLTAEELPYEVGTVQFFLDAETNTITQDVQGFDPLLDWAEGEEEPLGQRTLVARVWYPVDRDNLGDSTDQINKDRFFGDDAVCLEDAGGFLLLETFGLGQSYTFTDPTPAGGFDGLLYLPAIVPLLRLTEGCDAKNGIYLNAPVAEGIFPVIITDHGDASLASSGNLDLVRNGYIIAGVDHLGDSNLTQIGQAGSLLDGRVPTEREDNIDTVTGVYARTAGSDLEDIPRALKRIQIRILDDFALVDALRQIDDGVYDKVLGLNEPLGELEDHLDMQKLGYSGESFGGSVALGNGDLYSLDAEFQFVVNSMRHVFDVYLIKGTAYLLPPFFAGDGIFTTPLMAIVGNQDEAMSFLSEISEETDRNNPWPYHIPVAMDQALAPSYYALVKDMDHLSMFGKANEFYDDLIPDVLYKESIYDINTAHGDKERYELINSEVVKGLRGFLEKTWFDIYIKGELCSGKDTMIVDTDGKLKVMIPASMNNIKRLLVGKVDQVGVIKHHRNLVTDEIDEMIGNRDIMGLNCNQDMEID